MSAMRLACSMPVIRPECPQFFTATNLWWKPLLKDDAHKEIVISSLRFLVEKKRISMHAFVLMPNHIHLIAVPSLESGLARGIGEAHRRYSRMINFREGWRGFLWQGRFFSCLLDQNHLLAAVRYVERNSVRAGLTDTPWEYPWSSALAHCQNQTDGLVQVEPLLSLVSGSWQDFLQRENHKVEVENFRLHARTGRPLGNDHFLDQIEQRLGRTIRPGKPGPKPKTRLLDQEPSSSCV